jgi:enoyl-CoA hydratase/carnithine racemase
MSIPYNNAVDPPMVATVLVTRNGVIATVALHNPEKLNALTVSMWKALKRELESLSADESLRCVVVRGHGTAAFAAGADVTEFARVRDNAEQGRVYHRQYVAGALEAVAACRHPTVAMIHGACAGGGLEIACQCDLRVAGESARLGVPIHRLGFPIAYDELAALLPLVGRAVALEMLVEGRMWAAREALAKGLVTRVVADADLDREAYETARHIADGAPLVARWHKRFVRKLSVQPVPLTEAEVDANFDYFGTEDYRIGYDAFINKRAPRFAGR